MASSNPFGDITYVHWCEFLKKSGAVVSPGELHGFLCGLICGGTSDSQDWLTEAWGFSDVQPPSVSTGDDEGENKGAETQAEAGSAQVKLALEAMFEMTFQALSDDSYSFQLLLPEDEAQIQERTAALAEWCQGYLHAMGMQVNIEAQLDKDAIDGLKDLTQIAQMGDEDEENEENEVYFQELVEYCRVLVFSICSQSGPAKVPSEANKTH